MPPRNRPAPSEVPPHTHRSPRTDPPATARTAASRFARDYWRLTRPPIVALVLLTMAVSAWTAGRPPFWPAAAHALAGTALMIVGAIALNQRLECRGDAKMARTAGRPLPAGGLTRRHVTSFGIVATAIGLVYLAVAAGFLLTALAGINWLLYLAAYTPLKTRSAWQTPIGAAAGAMPVLLGAAIAGQTLSPPALMLFGMVYCWQFPHSMAIAWRYRREFAAAGVKVAAVSDPSGRTVGLWAVAGAAALLAVTLAPLWLSSRGATYGYCAAGLGAALLVCAVAFARSPTDTAAGRLLWASLIYLPAMLAVLVVC